MCFSMGLFLDFVCCLVCTELTLVGNYVLNKLMIKFHSTFFYGEPVGTIFTRLIHYDVNFYNGIQLTPLLVCHKMGFLILIYFIC